MPKAQPARPNIESQTYHPHPLNFLSNTRPPGRSSQKICPWNRATLASRVIQASGISPAFKQHWLRNSSASKSSSTATCGSSNPLVPTPSTNKPSRPTSMFKGKSSGLFTMTRSNGESTVTSTVILCWNSLSRTGANLGSIVAASTAQRAVSISKDSFGNGLPIHPRNPRLISSSNSVTNTPRGTPNSKLSLKVRSEFLPSRRSEEHTSELQSRRDLVCRLLLEKKKKEENLTTVFPAL